MEVMHTMTRTGITQYSFMRAATIIPSKERPTKNSRNLYPSARSEKPLISYLLFSNNFHTRYNTTKNKRPMRLHVEKRSWKLADKAVAAKLLFESTAVSSPSTAPSGPPGVVSVSWF